MARRPVLTPTARGPWRWAVGGAVAGLAAASLLFIPARWAAARVADATGGQVQLQDARGTLWNGSAQLVLTGGQGSQDAAALPSRLNWTLRPGWLGLRAHLQADCCIPQPLAVGWRWAWHGGRVQVDDGQSRWPAGLLAGLGTPWNTLQLEGDLALQTRTLAIHWAEGRLAVDGQAELLASQVASRVATLRPLGSYKLVLSGGAVPGLQLSTQEGALQLSGSGQWVGSRLRFQGQAQAAPEREAALANLLNIIGRRNGPRSIITIG